MQTDAMDLNNPTSPAQPGGQPPESQDESQIVLTDTVMSGVIRESVRRHVPIVQVVAERRGERPAPAANEVLRPSTSPVPVSQSFWSRCLRRFRKSH